MTSGRRKKIVIAGVVPALRGRTVCSCTDFLRTQTTKRKGRYIPELVCVGEQVSDDCLYVAVGEPFGEEASVVIYRQNDEKNVRKDLENKKIINLSLR